MSRDINFKSKDYIAELLAFETLVIPIFIYSAISERTTLVPFIVGTMTSTALFVTVSASSIQRISTPSKPFMFTISCSLNPLKKITEPVFL